MAGSLPKEQGLAARLSPRMWARGLERTASGSGGRRDKGKEKERDTSRVRGPTIERASSRARAIRPPVLQNGHSTVNVNASLSTPAYATSVPPSPNYSQSHAVKKTRHGSFDFERPVMVQPSPHHAGAPRAHVKKVHLPPPAPLTSSSHATATATATGTGAGSWGRRTATGMAKRPQLGGAGLAHGAFAFEPAVSTSTSGSVVSERSVAAGGSTSSRTGTAKARAVTGDTVLAPGDRGKRPAARGRSLDLGIGLAWAPTKVRQEAVLPSFRGPSARGYAHPGTADAMEALRGILGEPAFATLTKCTSRVFVLSSFALLIPPLTRRAPVRCASNLLGRSCEPHGKTLECSPDQRTGTARNARSFRPWCPPCVNALSLANTAQSLSSSISPMPTLTIFSIYLRSVRLSMIYSAGVLLSISTSTRLAPAHPARRLLPCFRLLSMYLVVCVSWIHPSALWSVFTLPSYDSPTHLTHVLISMFFSTSLSCLLFCLRIFTHLTF